MTYSVKEIFYTLQGEGGQAGMPAVFCRFAGCNLWTGREQDRPKAICQFCDTDFVGTDGTLGGKFATADELAERILGQWPADDSRHRMVVLTGGEPLLQVDQALIAALHMRGFRISVESNGTVAAPEGIDWLCISPKAGADWIQRSGQELKLVWPQPTFDLAAIEASTEFQHYFLQPMDNAQQSSNIAACIAQCMLRPGWRLSLQTHKLTGIR
ncbi:MULTISPECIES: 7-carboxy-7-deazaguanine synthase [Comamonas]|uniref:7-carboxy-7-deazaguanine synthase n=1 Tax=Comamonas thiooxydans TaxID=363952 RepID=A0AA42Q534_9BURK|nr:MULTISPECIES: 7-carboxy-7-deazaguanine synthase [Comamonas]BCX51579.1 7-carboxy-7-deazaguanine synthase [Comamonas testosteroni]MDH1335901.1 7-carboxy-7-deazaguanine synthase [Comamonas thiooxydans]MDH1476929.1 7-carboxy-7-deazaguanine synthase [Comamonas thiooxydans]MDH1742497.1 7-carboxy-7-deazaguanine synthase [Comamonas thiooxydans]MDH1788444.1 7-carboxy-7-deazaguanine synthase [Comamonas thiooxydans]